MFFSIFNVQESTSMYIVQESTSTLTSFFHTDKDYLRLLNLAIEARVEDRFAEAARYFTKAIDNFWMRKRVLSLCVDKCSTNSSLVSLLNIKSSVHQSYSIKLY